MRGKSKRRIKTVIFFKETYKSQKFLRLPLFGTIDGQSEFKEVTFLENAEKTQFFEQK